MAKFNNAKSQLFLQDSNITKKVKAKILTFLSTCLLNGKVKVKVAHSCPTLWNPIEYSQWNSPGQNTGVGSCSLFQGKFPTQGSNQGLPKTTNS